MNRRGFLTAGLRALALGAAISIGLPTKLSIRGNPVHISWDFGNGDTGTYVAIYKDGQLLDWHIYEA